MKLYTTQTIKGKTYHHFIEYALQKSDFFTVFIPHFEIASPKMKQMHQDAKLTFPNLPDMETEAEDLEYYDRVNKQFAPIEDLIVDRTSSFLYYDNEYGHLCEIIRINAEKDRAIPFLWNADNLFRWQYPFLPEDPAFITNDRCWCQVVAHEKQVFFDLTDISESKALLKMGIRLNDC